MLAQPDFTNHNPELNGVFELVMFNGSHYDSFEDALRYGAVYKLGDVRNSGEAYTALNASVFALAACGQEHRDYALYKEGAVANIGLLDPAEMNRYAKNIDDFIKTLMLLASNL